MLVGFFMTLIDWTAVAVANPSIMAALQADYESVIWVTSAYLLGFAWQPRRRLDAHGMERHKDTDMRPERDATVTLGGRRDTRVTFGAVRSNTMAPFVFPSSSTTSSGMTNSLNSS